MKTGVRRYLRTGLSSRPPSRIRLRTTTARQAGDQGRFRSDMAGLSADIRRYPAKSDQRIVHCRTGHQPHAKDARVSRDEAILGKSTFARIRRYSVEFDDIRPFRGKKLFCAVLADGCEPHGPLLAYGHHGVWRLVSRVWGTSRRRELK